YRVGGQHAIAQGAVAVVVLVLSYLMVSRIRFRSFKDLTINKRSVAVMFLLVVASITIYLELRAPFIFVFLMASYITLGLMEKVMLGPDDNEEEVLRELGAFDDDEPDAAAGGGSHTKGHDPLHVKPHV